MNKEIKILLATYNGEEYLKAQLDSILNQTYTNWKLLIRDDNSSDRTIQIIEFYQNKNPERISFLKDSLGNVGSVQNFNLLLLHAKDASYIMFCDQDDVWLPCKIELTLKKLIDVEQQFIHGMPVLVHTKFIYVDKNLQPIQSKKNYSATKIKNLNFNHILAQNPVYGCTMMFNQHLLKLVQTIPSVAENHDYWVALVAAALGKIFYLDQPTVYYRQHDKNISTNYDNSSFTKRFKRIAIKKKNFADVNLKQKMALKFNEIYCSELNSTQKKIISDFINLYNHKSLTLLYKNILNGIRRQTLAQTVLFYVTIFLYKDKYLRESK